MIRGVQSAWQAAYGRGLKRPGVAARKGMKSERHIMDDLQEREQFLYGTAESRKLSPLLNVLDLRLCSITMKG